MHIYYAHTYIHTYMHAYIHTYMHTCKHAYHNVHNMYACMYLCMCIICMYVCIYVGLCMYVCTRTVFLALTIIIWPLLCFDRVSTSVDEGIMRHIIQRCIETEARACLGDDSCSVSLEELDASKIVPSAH